MKKENVFLFFIFFFNAIQIISDFRLFQDKVDKRKKDSLVKDNENVKKNIIENVPYRLSEKLETNVKANPFPKNLEEKSSYLVLNIEPVKTNETKVSKTQPVSNVKKNSSTSNKEFSIKIPAQNKTGDELKNQSAKDGPLPVFKDVLSVGIKSEVNKTEGTKKIDFHALKDEEEKIKDIKEQIKKIKENIIDTRKDKVRKQPEAKKPDLVHVNRTDKNQSIIKSELDKKLQNISKIKQENFSQNIVKKDDGKKNAVKTDSKKDAKMDSKKDVDEKDDKKNVVKKDAADKKENKNDVVRKDKKTIKDGSISADKNVVEKKAIEKGEIKDDKKSTETKIVKSKDVGKKVVSATKTIDVKEKESKVVKNNTIEKRAEKPVRDVKLKQKTQHFLDPLNYYYNFKNLKNERCKKDGEEFENSLRDGKMWAMKMYDASAKIPSNILKGNLNQLGDYDQCINLAMKLHENKKDKMLGKYCLASIDIEATEDYMRLPVNLAQGRTFLRSRNKDPGHFIPKFSTIRWGVCVPDSCSANDVEYMLKRHIENHNTSFSDLKFSIVVDSDECATKSHFSILDVDYATVAAVTVIVIFMVISILATIKDYALNVDKSENDDSSVLGKIFMSFSIKQTKKSFLNTASDEIPCIHGIRALTTILLYIAHKLIPLGHSPYTNRVLLTEMSNSPFSIILRVSIIYTDTFLLLSGILTAYHMSKDLDGRGYIPWVNRVFSRIIRLLPTLVVILLYYSYIMDETGSGPLWNTVITENANLCKDNWWKNVLFVQNLYPFEEMCATHTHQLALDMQLFLIAPVLVWLLQKRTYLGLFITLMLHVISAVLRYYTTMKYKLSVIIYHGISLNQLFRTANLLYASSVHRATPYIAGVCLGVTLRQLRPDFKIPKILSLMTWIVAGYLIYWIFYTPVHLSDRMYRYSVEEAALFSSFCSVAWAFALSWIIFSSHLNYEGYLNKYLSSTPMILISKLSYTIYLVQFIIFFYNVGTTRAPTEFNINEILNVKEFSTIMGVSVMLFLVVDLPMQEIKKILMRPSSHQ